MQAGFPPINLTHRISRNAEGALKVNVPHQSAAPDDSTLVHLENDQFVATTQEQLSQQGSWRGLWTDRNEDGQIQNNEVLRFENWQGRRLRTSDFHVTSVELKANGNVTQPSNQDVGYIISETLNYYPS